MDADGSNQTNLTNHVANDTYGEFSPDGIRIAFTSHRDVNSEICIMNANGSDQTRVTNNPALDAFPRWRP
jgi:TolB protein